MISIESRRQSAKKIYLNFINGNIYEVRKLALDKYKYALSIYNGENPEFLYRVSWPTRERDIIDSYSAVVVNEMQGWNIE